MRKSHAITLVILGTALLYGGCGSRSRTFYDANGRPVPRSQWRDASGNPKTLYDEKGNVVPAEEINAAYASTSGSSTTSYRRSSSWFGPSYRSSTSRGGFGSSSFSLSS